MSISATINNAFSGVQASSKRLAATANNVANADTDGYNHLHTELSSFATGGVSATVLSDSSKPIDLADEMIDTVTSEIGFKANAAVFETGADLWDVLMSIKRD